MKFKGTIIAIVVIIVLAILNKFVFKEDFTRKDELVEPTEDVTMKFLENTKLGILPTE